MSTLHPAGPLEQIAQVRHAPGAALAAPIDFGADPETVRLVVEGHRLAYGHLHNPSFATEISRIELLPHQRIAVYERIMRS